ncbi:MAG: response regulator transcription factor [Anaerolineae bacterium]|nr:response regulator transcription factor [Anaerolineae bacterium]
MPRPRRISPPPVLTIGPFCVDRNRHTVTVGDRLVHLTPKETLILWTLMQRPDNLVTRADLMRDVWETSYMDDTRTLDVHMSWLRKKIEADPAHPVHLKTVRGQGYMFVTVPEPIPVSPHH